MIVTDLAYREIESGADGLVGGLARLFRRLRLRRAAGRVPIVPDPGVDSSSNLIHLVTSQDTGAMGRVRQEADRFRWRRHPQLRVPVPASPDQEDLERGARSAAVRGLFLARSGRFDEAREAFGVAAADPEIDLTAIPGFWDLSRGGMMAAVGAYEDGARYREAAALAARVRLTYRPRTVATLPIVHPRRSATTGS